MTIPHIAAKQQEIITIAIAGNPCGMRGKAPGKLFSNCFVEDFCLEKLIEATLLA